jgi:putative redox protein
MPTAKITYLGDLRCQSTHVQSGTAILTDAPTDNHGKGEAFSPTDLVATALGTCLLTTVAIFAQRDGIDISGSEVDVQKVMSSTPPRRIAEVIVDIHFKSNVPLDDSQKAKYEKIAHTCPVAISLHPDLVQTLNITWS